MHNGYGFLVEKEEMWAKMLMQVLEDNQIPCTPVAVHGAGFALKTGLQDRLKLYVPESDMARAMALVEELFPEESIVE